MPFVVEMTRPCDDHEPQDCEVCEGTGSVTVARAHGSIDSARDAVVSLVNMYINVLRDGRGHLYPAFSFSGPLRQAQDLARDGMSTILLPGGNMITVQPISWGEMQEGRNLIVHEPNAVVGERLLRDFNMKQAS